MRFLGIARFVGAATVVAVVAAACGGGNSATSTSPSTIQAASRSNTTSGTAVKFTLIADVTPPPGQPSLVPLATYKATIAAVNAAGGVNGHPLQMDVCDSQANPSATESCARQAVANHAPIVLSYANAGGSYLTILEQAGIPVIDQQTNPGELTSKDSFAIGPAGLGLSAGFGTIAVRLRCTKLAYLAVIPASYASVVEATYTLAKRVAENNGIQVSPMIQAPPGSPDLSPYLAHAVQEHADCIVFLAKDADAVAVVKAARQANITAKLITDSPAFPGATVKSLGSLLNGVNVDDEAWPTSSARGHTGVEQFVHDITTFSTSPSLLGTDGAAWMDVRLAAHVAASVKTVDAASMLAALDSLHGYQPGLVPAISYDAPAPANTLGPRVFQPYVVIGQFENGTVVPFGFFDIGTAKPVPFT
jgi:branched-chain amino acid transport system substrate-binding protein